MKRGIVVGQVRKAADNVEETRTIEFVASDNTRDSHGTIVPADKWDLDRFNKNGIIGYQHNVYGASMCSEPNPDDVIGIGQARVEGGELIVAVTFEPAEINATAEKIFRKVLHGTLKAVSVGFAPTKDGYWGEGEEAERGANPTYYFDGQELLELSIVNIPSNKNALKRGLRGNTFDALNFVYKALDGKKRYAEIEEMKVRDILDLIDNRNNINTKSDGGEGSQGEENLGEGEGQNGEEGESNDSEEGNSSNDDGEAAKQKALDEQRQADEDFVLNIECELAV